MPGRAVDTDLGRPPVLLPGPGRGRSLIVDDDRLCCDLYSQLLRAEGFDCVTTRTGGEAVEMLRSSAFDLVLCDLLMPPPDGQAVIEEARQVAAQPAVVVVTGLTASDRAVRAVRDGGWPVLFKPVDATELSRSVAWALHARQVRASGVSRDHLEALHGMSTAVNAEPDVRRALDRFLTLCLSATGADTGSVMLAGESHPRTLTIAASHGLAQHAARSAVRFGERIVGWVAANQRPVRLTGPAYRYPQFPGLSSNPEVAESLVAPIIFRGDTLGTVSLSTRTTGTLGNEELVLLVSAAEIAAPAIHRAHLERAREHQDRLAILGTLCASVAHEVNNPLAVAVANAAALAQRLIGSGPARPSAPGTAENDLRESLADLQEALHRIGSLVANLRSLSRRSSSTRAVVDLNTIARRAAAVVHPQIKHRARLSVEEGSPAPVLAEAGRILQILVNLLLNAAQAVGENGLVVVRTRAEADATVVEVEDNGQGIPPEVASRLFEAFFTTKTEEEGTGLGLNISRQIAVEHGGSLTFVSEPGQGTCFTLRLPAQSKADRRPVILAVDDEPALLRAVQRCLGEAFEVHTAHSAEEALRAAQGRTIDLILTDYSMPRQDGLSLIQALRSSGHSAPAALITAIEGNPAIEQAVATGLVCSIVRKPWSPSYLLAEVSRLTCAPPQP